MSYMTHCLIKAFRAGQDDGEEELKYLQYLNKLAVPAYFGENELGLSQRAYEYARYEVHASDFAAGTVALAYIEGFYSKSISKE